MTEQSTATHIGDVIELRVPADAAYVSLLRSASAGLAARLDFTVDEIDDLRIAVDEACALVLPNARAEAQLICSFTLGESALQVTVRAATTSASRPESTSFAWMVLTALASEVSVDTSDGHEMTVRLSKARSASP